MSRRSKTVLCCLAVIALVAATSAFLITRASPEPRQTALTNAQVSSNKRRPRNLSLQPEAAAVARKLGTRFTASIRSSSFSGSLAMGGVAQPLNITRTQTDAGEQLSVVVGGRSLTWTDQEGTKAVAGVMSDSDRSLVERLTLDSPDQFVLAQLRGASYFTIARHVRPADANDGYTGPLWNLVRVDEPKMDEPRTLSSWRIFYVNVQTGLPDRIEYELNGKPITADFREWTKQAGETFPTVVQWSSNGQLLMELRVTTISLN